LVLDTNILVSALLFRGSRLAWLREAWQGGRIIPLVCAATAEELLRVLAYPKFRLSRDEINELLAEILPYAETVTLPESPPAAPRCRDPNDQVFFDLAIVADADGIVTGDQDLLALADEMRLPVCAPAQWREALVS
jgi:putative PIN family toxin of toxin-antitoxin system